MSQQINLFNPALRPKKELLTAGLMAQVVLLFVVVLGVYGGYLHQQVAKLQQQRDALAQQTQAEQERMVQVAQQFPARRSSKALQDEIVATQDKIQQREQVFNVLKSGVVGVNGGFSGVMQAFARQNVEGLWLTGFSASSAGNQMRISGRALSPEMIPEYISKLSEEQALHGRAFTSLQVSQPKRDAVAAPVSQQNAAAVTLPSYVEFSLSAEKPADAAPAKNDNASVAGVKS